MRKTDELTNPTSCLNRAADDEPLFVLRAHDPLSAHVVAYWCSLSGQAHLHADAVPEAFAWIREAEAWRARENSPEAS